VVSAASQPFAAFLSQSAKPALHWTVQAFASQAARPLAGTGQTWHVGPHAAGSVFAAQAPGHAWKSALHVNPHAPFVHVAAPFATVAHLLLHRPQWLTLVCESTQSVPQSVGAAAVQPVEQANVPSVGPGAQRGAVAGHAVSHAPQWSDFERSVSHPSAISRLQSAWPAEHAMAHAPSTQLAAPCSVGHGAQSTLPHPKDGSLRETQMPSQIR
jgi:hypothetical protein